MGNKKGGPRVWVLLVLCVAVFGLFMARLVYLQFFRADYYHQRVAQAESARYTISTPAARGDIVDKNGVLLATDSLCYDVYLRLPAPSGTDPAATLQEIQKTLNQEGSKDVETQLAAFSASVGAGEFLAAKGLPPAQAEALYQSPLCGLGAFRLAARGVRTWPNGALLPHLLGSTGPITAEQWAANDSALQKAGYPMNAVIGQSGLETAFEAALHGRDGKQTLSAQRDGGGLQTAAVTEPQPGSTLRLTIDAGLQALVQTALQSQIETLRATKGPGKGREATAGAAVVVDTKTGGILAAASCPGFDLNSYRADYAALSADAARPLYDRVGLGLYAPGSAFKPAVAVAALAAGLITPADTVQCGGVYRFYSGYQPGCLQLSHGGAIDLHTALKYSCNIYFYDVGRRLGVDAFAAMAARLGLGAGTGAELPEAAGSLTTSADENYQAGLALQAAIGQGNTAVTPLQLASYAATLANGGVRRRLHYADALLDGRTGAVVQEFAPEILDAIPGGEDVFGPVQNGMEAVATTLLALRDPPAAIACKTGSPQRADRDGGGNYYTNSVLVGYAPADDPQIAVSVVIEYGGGGANAAPVLRAVVDHLFGQGTAAAD